MHPRRIQIQHIKTDKYKNVNFHIVLGRENVDIVDLLREHNNIEILHSKNNIQQVMSKCDIGVISSGNIAYELAMFGMPSIVIAQNQREACHDFVCEENGFSYLGLTPSDQLIEHTLDFYIAMSKGERLRHHKMLVSHDLRNGRSRVIKLINSL